MRDKKRRKKNRDLLGNRLALFGITAVVISMGLVVGLKVESMKIRQKEYQLKEESLEAQYLQESQRAEELEEYKVYVQTKQYIEKVAKEKLGLVRPDEILLKPSED